MTFYRSTRAKGDTRRVVLNGMLVGLLNGACADSDPELPPVRARVGRVEYRSDTDLSTCRRAPEAVDERLRAVEAILGIPGPSRLTYVHVAGSEYDDIWPCGKAPGCTDGSRSFSRSYVHHHEVVHAVTNGAGRPNALLVEGLATALGYNPVSLPATPDDWRDLAALPVGEDDSGAYASGAALAAYLYRRFGAEPLVELYARATTDAETLAPSFEELYGAPLDQAWIEAHEEAAPYICGELASAPLDGTELVEADSACPGPSDDFRHAFALEAPTPLWIETNYYRASLNRCEPGAPPPFPLLDTDVDGSTALYLGTFPTGRYFVSRAQSSSASVRSPSFRAGAGSFVGTDCAGDAGTAFTIDTAPTYLQIAWNAGIERHVVIDSTEAEPLVYEVSFADELSATFRACATCDSAECEIVDRERPLVLRPGQTWLVATLRPGRDPGTVRLLGRLSERP